MDSELREVCEKIANDLGLKMEFEQIWYSPPVPFNQECVASVRRAAENSGYSHRDIISGAGHDACYISRVAPTAMVFVPCEDGISHNESENADPADIAAGCDVLFQAVVEQANKL